ncbi:hypothetical protein C9374_008992 [Naegleria lovaniensis]|uniref:Leucine-rich repeat protein n=1 Tax=Naegleria lovaniensis TaxID=51637 RepID=A0AA88KEZ4_NAELO|nr:uncharacterized protein C9374_008992 [Naegleria lovaniensis]KAG2377907.1 hypothetical protein C9374_008992 [Naegleria lovaniensis]
MKIPFFRSSREESFNEDVLSSYKSSSSLKDRNETSPSRKSLKHSQSAGSLSSNLSMNENSDPLSTSFSSASSPTTTRTTRRMSQRIQSFSPRHSMRLLVNAFAALNHSQDFSEECSSNVVLAPRNVVIDFSDENETLEFFKKCENKEYTMVTSLEMRNVCYLMQRVNEFYGARTKMSKSAEKISKLKKLRKESMSVGNLDIDSSPKKKLIPEQSFLDHFPSLEKLVCTDIEKGEVNMTSYADICEYITSGTSLPHLTTIDFISSRRSVSAVGCQHLANGKISNLKTLNLSLGSGCDEVTNKIDTEGCTFIASGNLSQLTQLNLSGNPIQGTGCKYLANGNLRNLTNLELKSCRVDTNGCLFLVNGNLPNLSHLDVSYNLFVGEGAKYFGTSKALSNLVSLNLAVCDISSEVCSALASGNLTSLTYLNVSFNTIQNEGCRMLTQSSNSFPNLKELRATNCQIEADGLWHLTNGNLPKLEKLDLKSNKIQDEGCSNLSSRNLPNLTHLNLTSNMLGPLSCKYIASMHNLTRLYLARNAVGTSGCRYLSKGSITRSLEYLDLEANDIRCGGCHYLAHGTFDNLNILILLDNKIENDGFRLISESKYLTKLVELHVIGNDEKRSPRSPRSPRSAASQFAKNNIDFMELLTASNERNIQIY